MNLHSELIVMLTHNDHTVHNAYEIFEQCRNSKAVYWGFKEEPLSSDEMKKLYAYMKSCGKKTVLEVVAYTEKEGLEGAKMAIECECDILMGTMYSDTINALCRENNLKYMPFVGKVTKRPSILEGTIDSMLHEADRLLQKGVYGFDLLGYRYIGDAVKLNQQFVSGVNAPVCIAGSVNSYRRLDEIKQLKPWAFTIGSAFFEKQFGNDFCEQINKVCEYIDEERAMK